MKKRITAFIFIVLAMVVTIILYQNCGSSGGSSDSSASDINVQE